MRRRPISFYKEQLNNRSIIGWRGCYFPETIRWFVPESIERLTVVVSLDESINLTNKNIITFKRMKGVRQCVDL